METTGLFEDINNEQLLLLLGLRYLINLAALVLLTRFTHYRLYPPSDLLLPFFSFNSIIFFVTYMLNKVEMSTGAAFGLFAVFSILRYRTEGISAKDMTYLFLSIAIGLLTAVSKVYWQEQAVICALILALTFLLESNILMKKESSKTVLYDNIGLTGNGNNAALLEDLRKRTGLNIHRYEILEIDFLKDACRITIYFYEN